MRIAGRIHRLTDKVTDTTITKASTSTKTAMTPTAGGMMMGAMPATTKYSAAAAAAAAEMASLTSDANKQKFLDAVKYAHQMWQIQSHFRDIKIMTVSAIGTVDCLTGPDLEPLIKNAPGVATVQGKQRDLRDAVAHGVSECFAEWQDFVTVPGLPWYPSFAAFPGPQAPPTPNVPMPLIACVSSKTGRITSASSLKDEMTAVLTDALDVPEIHAFLDSICQSIAMAFLTWLPAQQAMNVLGQGPVPSFAPPYVPVGPVIGGSILPIPGHFVGGPALNMIVFPTAPV